MKNAERHERKAPRAAKSLRKLAREKTPDAFAALRIGLIDAAMRTDDETVEIIDQTRVARFSARDGKVRCGAPVNAAELANFFRLQPSQGAVIEQFQQVFESLPGVFALFDEAVGRHISSFLCSLCVELCPNLV